MATIFKKIRFYTRENVGAGDIHLPPEELDTESFVLTLSEEAADELGLEGGDRGSAWRAVGELLRRGSRRSSCAVSPPTSDCRVT